MPPSILSRFRRMWAASPGRAETGRDGSPVPAVRSLGSVLFHGGGADRRAEGTATLAEPKKSPNLCQVSSCVEDLSSKTTMLPRRTHSPPFFEMFYYLTWKVNKVNNIRRTSGGMSRRPHCVFFGASSTSVPHSVAFKSGEVCQQQMPLINVCDS